MTKAPIEMDLALLAIDASEQANDLMEARDQTREFRPSFKALYQYIQGLIDAPWQDFHQVMQQHPDAAADFEHLLRTHAFARLPELAAAASNSISHREHEGYLLALNASIAAPDQVYLSIETNIDLSKEPRHIFIKSADMAWIEIEIPPMTNGRAQIVLTNNDPAVHAFRQPDAVLYIR
jgi:hypothetical protein